MDCESRVREGRTARPLVAAWESPRRRLVPAGRVRRDRRSGGTLQRLVLELRSRQGLGNGRQDRRDPQRHRRAVDRAVACRNGLPDHTHGTQALEGLVPPHRPRSGRRLDALQLHRPRPAVHALAGIPPEYPGLRSPGRGDDRPGDVAPFPEHRPASLVLHALCRLPHAGAVRRLLGRSPGQALDRHPLGHQPPGQEARRATRSG